MFLSHFTCLFILFSLSAGFSSKETISNPLIEIAEEPKAKFGDLIYKALNEDGLNKEPSNKKTKRVRMRDVPYFDILNKNREFRRQIISPGQLPRQPKERWEQGRGTKTLSGQKYVDSMSIKSHQVDYDGTDANGGSSKQAKQLHYYGPEFLKLLGLSYESKTQHDKGIDEMIRLTKSRSLKEMSTEETIKKKDNKTTETADSVKDTFLSSVANAASSQLGVSLASNILGHPPIPSPPSHHDSFPHYPNDDDNYNDDKENNKHETKDDKRGTIKDNKTKKKKNKGRPNQGHNRFSQPAYSPYSLSYTPYSGGQHPGLVSSGLIDPYQHQLVGQGPNLQSNFVPVAHGYPGSIGSISDMTHVPSNTGNLYEHPYPQSYSSSGFPSTASTTTPTFSNSGYSSLVPITTTTLGNSGFPSSASISTPTFGNSGYTSSVPTTTPTLGNSGFPSSAFVSTPTFSNSGFPSSSSSAFSNSGFSSSYPIGHGYTPNAFSVPYYGSPHGRTETATPESRKKGSTSVKKVVGGALAAGAGLAILGAINNNRRPHYGHYPNYRPHYPTPASSAYSSYGYSPYPLPSQPLYPTYAQPAYSTYATTAYPNNYGGYRPVYPYSRSPQNFLIDHAEHGPLACSSFDDHNSTATNNQTMPRSQKSFLVENVAYGKLNCAKIGANARDQTTPRSNENEENYFYGQPSSATDDKIPENMPELFNVDVQNNEVENVESLLHADTEHHFQGPPGANGLILYPTLVTGPIILSSQPSHFVQTLDKRYNKALFAIHPYHSRFFPITISAQMNPVNEPYYINGVRRKRSLKNMDILKINETIRESVTNITNKNNSTLLKPTLEAKRIIGSQSLHVDSTNNAENAENIGLKIIGHITKSETNATNYMTTLNPTLESKRVLGIQALQINSTSNVDNEKNTTQEMQTVHTLETIRLGLAKKKNKRRPSKGALLTAGLLGAAAGYAITNTGINSYHNRPYQHSGNIYNSPHYSSLHAYPGYPSYSYPHRPSLGQVYPSHYPVTPPYSPYYYPRLRSEHINIEEKDLSLQSKGINETRSPFIILGLKPEQSPNRFPYHQQFYYQQHQHAHNQQQQQHQVLQPQIIQPQAPQPNRFIYVYSQPFVQEQLPFNRLTNEEIE